MVTKQTFYETLHDELTTVLSNETPLSNFDASVSTANKHVGLLSGSTNHPYPFIGFEAFPTPVTKPTVDKTKTDQSGNANEIVYVKSFDVTTDFGVFVKDEPQLRDKLHTAVSDHFSEYNGPLNLGDLHSDVTKITHDGSDLEQRASDGVWGYRDTWVFRIQRFTSFTNFQPIDKVNITIEDDDSNTTAYTDTID